MNTLSLDEAAAMLKTPTILTPEMAAAFLGISVPVLLARAWNDEVPGAPLLGDKEWRFIKDDLAAHFRASVERDFEHPIGAIYIVDENHDHSPVKIGYTAGSVSHRVATLQVGNPRTLRLLFVIPATLFIEELTHSILCDHCVSGEWFRPTEQVRRFLLDIDARGFRAAFLDAIRLAKPHLYE